MRIKSVTNMIAMPRSWNAIVFMFYLYLFYLRLDALHEHLLFRAGVKKRVEDDADKKRHQYNRDAEIMKPDRVVEKNKKVEDRSVQYLLVKIDHGFLFLLRRGQYF